MINKLLIELGLGELEARVVELLIREGPKTVLKLAEVLPVKRSSLYRVLRDLEESSYVRKIPLENTTQYSGISVEYLHRKVEDHRNHALELATLYEKALPEIRSSEQGRKSPIGTVVYNGSEGVKQLIWNSLAAKTNILSFGYRTLTEAVGSKFLVDWISEAFLRKQKHKLLTNDNTVRIKRNTATRLGNMVLERVQYIHKLRYLPEEILKITTETFIYDDVFSVIQWTGDQVYGVEITNSVIADQQREVFNYLWKRATRTSYYTQN